MPLLGGPTTGPTPGGTARELRGGARAGPRDPDIAPARGCPSLRRGAVPLNLPRMAAAQGRLSDGAGGMDEQKGAEEEARHAGSTAPPAFAAAVEALRGARLRPQIEVEATRAPQRLAPYAYALEAAVVDGDDDLADGRLVLLHDPAGHDAWRGTFRLVTLVRAELEPEMAADPLLPDVCWSWLTGALQARGLTYGEPSGTVTRASSHYFGACRRARPPRRSRSGRPGRRARVWVASRTPRRTSPRGAICWPRSRACRRPRRVTRRSSRCRSAAARSRARPGPLFSVLSGTRAHPARETFRHFVDTATFGHVSTKCETVRSSNDRPRVRIARIVTHQIVIIL